MESFYVAYENFNVVMSTVEKLSQNEKPCDLFNLWQCYAKPELMKLIFFRFIYVMNDGPYTL